MLEAIKRELSWVIPSNKTERLTVAVLAVALTLLALAILTRFSGLNFLPEVGGG
jgi:hypothetical protein